MAQKAEPARISVVIPVYKSEDCLAELQRRLADSLEALSPRWEIVYVEDCGGDGSMRMLEDFAKADPRVKVLKLSRNFGQHIAITAGIDAAGGDWLVVMDCDLQDAPEAIASLYAKAQEGYDIVLAAREARQDGVAKRMSSQMFNRLLSWAAEADYDEQVGNFRIFSRDVADSLRSMPEGNPFLGAKMHWLGYSVATLPVQHQARHAGKSSYTPGKLVKLAVGILFAYSTKPLLWSVILGMVMSAASFLFGIFIICRALAQDISVPGWASLMVSIYFVGGLLLTSVGILGIYLRNLVHAARRRPTYIVKTRINH